MYLQNLKLKFHAELLKSRQLQRMDEHKTTAETSNIVSSRGWQLATGAPNAALLVSTENSYSVAHFPPLGRTRKKLLYLLHSKDKIPAITPHTAASSNTANIIIP